MAAEPPRVSSPPACHARIIAPSDLSALAKAASVTASKALYQGLSSEQKARVAVAQAFALSPAKLLVTYSVKRIIGFGSNGVVLAATLNGEPVAIKIIYKTKAALKTAQIPSEICVLKQLTGTNGSCSRLLKYIDDWQDSSHFYLVTELFGSDWMSSSASAPDPGNLEKHSPLVFKAVFENITAKVSLDFAAGTSDLWAWTYAHRCHIWESSARQHTFLPLEPIKSIVAETSRALLEMHSLGFFHGDVKIENVLVQSSGRSNALQTTRLADFGHAKHVSHGIRAYGTHEVSPPEFLPDSPFQMFSGSVDGRAADVFALGMVLYVLLNESGELPSAVRAIRGHELGYSELALEEGGSFPFDELAEVDALAMNLLNGMCRVDPRERLTIAEVLKHPWLADAV
ncbi:Serine/threonine-protein kinase dclk3 [Entophlyctis luteolus]|nr:Serine/threonine-protein kinase dclk3 [Entophlyctis luteolus]